jgi:hypothetical protein
LEQQSQCFVGDPVLGIVEIETDGLDYEPLPALEILGKELLEVSTPYLLVVLLEQRPSWVQV